MLSLCGLTDHSSCTFRSCTLQSPPAFHTSLLFEILVFKDVFSFVESLVGASLMVSRDASLPHGLFQVPPKFFSLNFQSFRKHFLSLTRTEMGSSPVRIWGIS